LLGDKAMDTSVLNSLIRETAEKVYGNSPAEVQTGPAKRNDKTTMDQHLQLLADFPEMKQVYTLLSAQIAKRYVAEK